MQYVFIVIATGFSEHTVVTEVRGVFAHMHQTVGLAAEIRAEGKLARIQKHSVEDRSYVRYAPDREGGQTDPSVGGIRELGRAVS